MSIQQSLNHDKNNGRLMLGVGGLLFIPLATAGTWFLFFVAPRPQGLFEWAVRILLDELAIGATLFFSIGFLWAISGHRRLRKVLDSVSVRFAWILLPLAMLSFVAVACIVLSCIMLFW